ncbi:Dihydrofolate reductase [Mesobacillus persicus]|uniref:Dihydrofolate reductase n=1 Tax=Mesobacillus persicus TaxID=930146 RepID=A0A1H8GZR6_9BACI|nr:dihydrofolate reductase family protein [Mesobacillus persicus]SEN49592.1 Dihydrofolate reductase [Mesobacillus persicus]
MKISVYIAASLDGFIANNTGAVDWLEAIEGDGDNGYGRYYSEVDAVVMGRKTYEVILGFDIPFPYRGKDCFVLTNQLTGSNEDVTFINGTVDDLMSALSTKNYKKAWVVGGGMLISELMNRHLIDELIVTVAPVLLGNGISLFSDITDFHALRLTDTTRYGQLVEMRYVVK